MHCIVDVQDCKEADARQLEMIHLERAELACMLARLQAADTQLARDQWRIVRRMRARQICSVGEVDVEVDAEMEEVEVVTKQLDFAAL